MPRYIFNTRIGGEGFFQGLFGGGVNGGDFLLDAEPVGGQAAGDVEELAGNDVSDRADDGKSEDTGDCDSEDAWDASGLETTNGGGQ